jgi:arylsulfatase A-like enzyme
VKVAIACRCSFTGRSRCLSGKRYAYPVSALDFYPTFAGLTGTSVPDTQKLDGKNIWSDFIADRNPRKDETIFAMRFHAAFGNVGVRQDQWKALCLGKNWSLYNLEKDIGATTDVSEQHPDVLKSLIAKSKVWSQTHTQPRWFDNPAAGRRWVENGMPNYDTIFPSK